MQLLIASLLAVTKSPEVDLDIYQDKARRCCYPIGYGLDKVNDLSEIRGFEVDGRSPEVVTTNQRACEVRIRD